MWQEFTPLAIALGAVNLGQGYPDWKAPRFVKDALQAAVEDDKNQVGTHLGIATAVEDGCWQPSGVFAFCIVRGPLGAHDTLRAASIDATARATIPLYTDVAGVEVPPVVRGTPTCGHLTRILSIGHRVGTNVSASASPR